MDRTVIILQVITVPHTRAWRAKLPYRWCDASFFDSTLNLRGYKGSVYEGGLRVPCIVRLPENAGAGRVIDAPAWFPDIFPTVCDVVGIKKPDGLDGVSLWNLLKGKKLLGTRPSPLLWVFPEYGGQMAVRLDDMKAVRRNIKKKSENTPWEVYDLATDPSETTDLAEKRPDIVAEAVEVLLQQTSPNSVFPMPNAGI